MRRTRREEMVERPIGGGGGRVEIVEVGIVEGEEEKEKEEKG
jgi:hypothetical protein